MRDSTIVRAMHQPGDSSVRVGVVAGDRREAVRRALDEDRGATTERTQPAIEVRSVADGERAAGAVTDSAVDCVVCATAAVYEAVRAADRQAPVVAFGPVEESLLESVLADPDAAYVADDERAGMVLPSRVRSLVERDRDGAGWQLADLADEAVVAFDLDSFAVREGNDVFFDHWAFEPDDLDGVTLSDLRVTDITHEFRGRGRGADGEEELEWIREGDPVETFVESARTGDFEVREWHCRDADGAGFKSEVRVVVDRATGVGYLVATVPEESHESGTDHDESAMLRSVLEHVPMSVYFEDQQGRHVRVSEDLVEPFIESPEGKILHTPADVHGKTYFDLYPVDVAEEATADNEEVMATGRPIHREEHVQPPHGADLWFQTTKAPWYDEAGAIRGIVGVTVDITEQKRRAQELDRQNQRLEEFAGIVSHDLRNPLNVASGRLELYWTTGDESNLDAVAEMHDRMAAIVDDVLTYAREGSHVEETEWFDGHRVAADAWAGVDTADATLDQKWAYAIEGDPDRLGRLFENCFRNAVEHAGEDVTVRVGTLDDPPGFYVEDDGPGIPTDERESALERGVSSDPDGTGFGLAIVREIAEAHGWDATVTESDAGGFRLEVTGVPRGDPTEQAA